MTILRILKKFCFGRAPRARITACMGRKCYLHGLLDDRTAILDAWHVLSCPVRHARALPARPELFASLFVCISFWVGSLRETLLRVLEVLGMSRVRSLKMMPRHHFGNFGAGRCQPTIFGVRGTRGLCMYSPVGSARYIEMTFYDALIGYVWILSEYNI